ncbi:hypothetical protein SAMN04489712_11557 [Thermomonospora echinospora]|uniref:Uncharacterized protein n=1 Tax=Thermomonospora echinospora TaxID=1992 RepID=A0A1H6DCY5_9ACTN|nr:hypothetical protein [Thermomonospora echinospora]SEG82653.1 hypothetical protein SAMN04489712_11557 [Thermomonospora echinospora]
MGSTAGILTAGTALLLTCGACASTEEPPRASPPVERPTTAAGSNAPRHEAVLEDPNPAQRPAGIDQQLRSPVGGGGDPCYEQQKFSLQTPYETEAQEYGYPDAPDPREPHTDSIPFHGSFCVVGSDRSRQVTVTLTSPSGKVLKRRDLPPEYDQSASEQVTDREQFDMRFLPGDEEGAYTLTAAQGDRRATRKIEVTRAAKPRIFLVTDPPSDGAFTRTGTGRITFAFGGLPTTGPTDFYLYHSGSGAQQDGFLTRNFHSTYKVTGGPTGTAFLDLRITPSAQAGYYYLVNPKWGTGVLWQVK